MLSRPPTNASIILQNSSLTHEIYIEQYAEAKNFKKVYASLTHSKHEENYFVHDQLLYHLGKLCIPEKERVHVIQEAHSSLIAGHFGVSKTLSVLQNHCYWPQMQETVAKYIRGCVMCATSKPSNRKLGLYTPLPVSSRPRESISMDFVGGLPMS